MPTPDILKGFLLTKEACARFNRSHRQLNRDRVKAMRLGDSKVTAHFKLQLENGDVISGEDLTIEQISTFRDEGRNPAWYVEAAWMEETYGRKGEPPRQQSSDANDISPPEEAAAEEGTLPPQPVPTTSTLDLLKDQLGRAVPRAVHLHEDFDTAASISADGGRVGRE
jgi:hypothetical protein